MKKLSVTMKLTLWYAFFMLLSIILTWYAFLKSANSAADRYYTEELSQAVSLAKGFASCENGYPEFEEMPDAMEHVHVSYFSEDGDLLYGHICADEELSPGEYKKAYDEYERHRYILDEAFELEGYGRILVRASISMKDAESIEERLSGTVFFVVPALLVLSLAGGFAMSRRAMRPVKRIAKTARSIAGGAELSLRIPVTNRADELGELSEVVNNMLSRLDRAFEREKRFTGDVSHELRTPVAATLSLSEAALMESANDEDRKKALQKIREKSLEMSGMIKNMLMLARMDAGKCDLQMEDADLMDIAEAVFPEAKERYEAKDVSVNINLKPAPCICDSMLIAQLVMNLTENAFRYTPDGGRIEIMTFQAAEGAIFVIENRGSGLAPGEENAVFDRFYRVNRARSGGGNGLGLSIAKAIANAHGAGLTCESEENAYVRFTLTLPPK